MGKVTNSVGRSGRRRRLGMSTLLAGLVVALCVGVFATASVAQDDASVSDTNGQGPTASAAVDPGNPSLGNSCGINMVLIVDRSGSTDSFDNTYKQAASGFVNGLSGTPNSMGVVRFSDSATTVSGYVHLENAADDTALASGLAGSLLGSPGGLTNWQDAMLKANAFNPHPDLAVFITDGNPTTDNGGGGTPLSNGVAAAQALRTAGTHITSIAVGDLGANGLDNLKSATGAGNVIDPTNSVDATHDVYQTSDPSGLADVLKTLTEALCGGTVTIHKQVRTSPSTTDSTTPGLVDGWAFTASGGPSGTTGDTGTGAVLLDFAANQLGDNTITESAGLAGYSIESATCNGQDAKLSGTTLEVTVGKLDVISCTVVNTPALGSITVNKVTTNGAGGPFTVNVSGPNSTNSNVSGSTVSKDTSTSLGSVSSLYPGDYTIDETAMPAGWAFTGVDCTDGLVEGDVVTVHVDAGENVVCTYTNDLVPTNLTITKTATEGANTGTAQGLDYNLSVDNTGPADAHVDATVVDMLPAGATLVSVDPPAGVTCDTSALPKISCTVPASQLEVSDPAVEIGVSVTVPNGSGSVTNKSLVTSPDDPAPCTVTSDDITCTDATDNYSEVTNPIVAVAGEDVTTGTAGPTVAAAEATALAFTGSNGTTPLVGVAALLVLIGALALVIARKRRGNVTE
jgi:hypothetical protein